MTGQIPPYGEHFRLGRADNYDTFYNHSVYVSKADPDWSIRARKGSKAWHVFYKGTRIGDKSYPTLTRAMDVVVRLLAAINSL